jgi:hypothetical protein
MEEDPAGVFDDAITLLVREVRWTAGQLTGTHSDSTSASGDSASTRFVFEESAYNGSGAALFQ